MGGSLDGTLILWNVENDHAICTYEGHTNFVNCVAKLTDTTFVSGSEDMTLKLWNMENNDSVRSYLLAFASFHETR